MKNKDKTIKKIIEMTEEIEKYGEDKLNAEIYHAILRKWLKEIIGFSRYLVLTPQKSINRKKVIKRFEKVCEIVGNDINYF